MDSLNAKQIVELVDETAKAHVWGDREGFWIKGKGWETKITYSETRAWELAVETIATRTVAVTDEAR